MADTIDNDLKERINKMNPVAAEAGLGDLLVDILARLAALEAAVPEA